MRDEDHRPVGAPLAADHLQDALGEVGGKRGSHLVEQQHVRLDGERTGEVDDPQARERQLASVPAEVEVGQTELREPVPECRQRCLGEPQVGEIVEVRDERRLLVDRHDAAPPRFGGGAGRVPCRARERFRRRAGRPPSGPSRGCSCPRRSRPSARGSRRAGPRGRRRGARRRRRIASRSPVLRAGGSAGHPPRSVSGVLRLWSAAYAGACRERRMLRHLRGDRGRWRHRALAGDDLLLGVRGPAVDGDRAATSGSGPDRPSPRAWPCRRRSCCPRAPGSRGPWCRQASGPRGSAARA